jgi:hypothetical protein
MTMQGVPRARRAWALAVCTLLAAACSRKGPPDVTAPARAQAEDAEAPRSVCQAIGSDAGTVTERFAPILPRDDTGKVTAGGALYVLQGDEAKVTDYMTELGVVDIRLATCPNGSFILFIPAFSEPARDDFARELAARNAIVRERHLLRPPAPESTGRRRTRDRERSDP